MSTDTFAKGDPSTTELNPQVPVKGKSGRFVPKRKGCFVEREKGDSDFKSKECGVP